jgi:hypothetical protein
MVNEERKDGEDVQKGYIGSKFMHTFGLWNVLRNTVLNTGRGCEDDFEIYRAEVAGWRYIEPLRLCLVSLILLGVWLYVRIVLSRVMLSSVCIGISMDWSPVQSFLPIVEKEI